MKQEIEKQIREESRDRLISNIKYKHKTLNAALKCPYCKLRLKVLVGEKLK